MWPNKDNFANFGYSSKEIIKKNFIFMDLKD